jgi:hypothetical protein
MHEAPVRALVISIALVALFSFFFVYPGHDPEPNGLKIAVVSGDAPGPAAAGAAASAPLPEGVEAVPARDAAAARRLILDREAYGALTPRETLVASAASFQVAQILSGMAEQRGAKVVDLRPLDPQDPRGTSLNLAALPLTVTSILGAMLLFTLAPRMDARGRLGVLALFALFGAIVSMLIVRVAIGVLPGSFLALTGVAALGIMALAIPASALMRWLGPPGIMASFLVFLMLGNPASGAAGAPELLPDPWSWGGRLLPPGALVTGLRNVAYFDAANALAWLTVLLVWAAAGAAALLAIRRPPLVSPPGAPPAGAT